MTNGLEHVTIDNAALYLGDCLDVLASLEPNSIDSVVTDPPYAFPGGFMGKGWDNFDGREDTGFGYWLAGFTDGEGCFRVQRHERGTHTCAFQIKLRRDDRAALERIRRFVGYGTINDVADDSSTSNPQAVYVVQDKAGCERLVALFRKFPLTAKKALDFEIWADAVEEWLGRPRGNRWHGASDQTCAAGLKARLETVRRYTDVPWSGNRFQDWCRLWALECHRVLKPGGHLLAFGSPRTCHRLASGIEDAGFEVRDQIMWLFGSGFPKSHNLEGEWDGWGTALKPAHEPIVVARKPLVGTVAENVQQFGTGAMNIDGCRIPGDESTIRVSNSGTNGDGWRLGKKTHVNGSDQGRWPANVIHDGSEEVRQAFPNAPGQQAVVTGEEPTANGFSGAVKFGGMIGRVESRSPRRESDRSAARFFYCPKASRKDRNEGLADPGPQFAHGTTLRQVERTEAKGNHHPTVKPTELMRYLCRLVTPPGGTVIDPFMGSGSTGKAAVLEGFRFIGIEREADYFEIAKARIQHAAGAVTTSRIKEEAEPDLFSNLSA